MALYGGGPLRTIIRKREITHSEGRNEEETDNPLQVSYDNTAGRRKKEQRRFFMCTIESILIDKSC